MRLRSLFFLLAIVFLLSGCTISTKYTVDEIDQQFSHNIKNSTTMAVAKFDGHTPSKAMSVGMAFGLLGVAIADAATASDAEVLGINLQNKTLKMLEEEISQIKNVDYKPSDLMEGTTVDEVSERFKSNRLWGFSSLKNEEIEGYFKKKSNIDFIIHITSFVLEYYSDLIVNTQWMIYNRNGSMVAKIITKTVDEIPRDLTEEAYFDEIIRFQKKNVKEFIRMLSSATVSSKKAGPTDRCVLANSSSHLSSHHQ